MNNECVTRRYDDDHPAPGGRLRNGTDRGRRRERRAEKRSRRRARRLTGAKCSDKRKSLRGLFEPNEFKEKK
ncbi:hypothetical protein NECAME_14783 [Necator americanus]|uniref:Uncharacterized protein n=1 Tax=Necator americanus TaxID=51031 RepID=W2SNY5_NECAM|nr:hypothetical protein NECAME_14783 [Necator americanus]ETN70412.1 hypothetical protein NECAME_14783 [Necator americanus]